VNDSVQVQQWIDQVKGGRVEVIGRLCDHYRNRLLGMIAIRMDQRLATRFGESDVLQEVYIEAVRRIDEYAADSRVDFYVWLRGLAMQRLAKLSRDHIHAGKRTTQREVDLNGGSAVLLANHMFATKPGPLTNLIHKELRHQLQLALERLPAEQREVIAMRHFEQMSNREVAQALGVSESGATRRYGRALRQLQRMIADGIPGEEPRT
jgi:RNA polymerase sigma-70 factor (ECF subfamily)